MRPVFLLSLSRGVLHGAENPPRILLLLHVRKAARLHHASQDSQHRIVTQPPHPARFHTRTHRVQEPLSLRQRRQVRPL